LHRLLQKKKKTTLALQGKDKRNKDRNGSLGKFCKHMAGVQMERITEYHLPLNETKTSSICTEVGEVDLIWAMVVSTQHISWKIGHRFKRKTAPIQIDLHHTAPRESPLLQRLSQRSGGMCLLLQWQ
jgi:hypothetical protein